MPIGVYNGGQTPLEAIAIQARSVQVGYNNYNNNTPANNYSATHTRAVSDQTTPVQGKGSGQFLDINNYQGVGGDFDINGNQANAIGSGRIPAFALNGSLWGYGPTQMNLQEYNSPNTSLNLGQVII